MPRNSASRLNSIYDDDGFGVSTGDDFTPTDITEEDSCRSISVKLGNRTVTIDTRPELTDLVWKVINQLGRSAALPNNWDSYGALSVSQRNLEAGLRAILRIFEHYPIEPQVGPSIDGGVLIEWHRNGKDLEIAIDQPLLMHTYFNDDERPGDAWEDRIPINDISRLWPYLDRVK